jgi:hypothetical protein
MSVIFIVSKAIPPYVRNVQRLKTKCQREGNC